MNLSDELRKLQDLHRSGALTDDEFAAAKAAVLDKAAHEAPTADVDAVRQQVAELSLDNAVARLDREWQLEREQYMIWGKYGARQVPTRSMSIVAGVIVAAFGTVWTVMALSFAGNAGGFADVFPMFGIVFILGGIGVAAYTYSKSVKYENAFQDYRRRREQLLQGQLDQRADEMPASEEWQP
jgi:hypothetical protein